NPSSSTTTTINNVKRLRYIGNLKVEHFISPRRASRNLTFIKNKNYETINKLKIAREKARRLQNKVKTYEDLNKVLEQKNLISENASHIL
ncbi:THAP-type domain-containing protein, partial [Aphis craccivora]